MRRCPAPSAWSCSRRGPRTRVPLWRPGCRRGGTDRVVSWSALATALPCLRCDGRRLDPESRHRVYLFEFAHLGSRGVY
jgi:hypothetical protein